MSAKAKLKKAAARKKASRRREDVKPGPKLVPGDAINLGGKGDDIPVRCRRHKDVDLSKSSVCPKCETPKPAPVPFDRVHGLTGIGFDELVEMRQEAHKDFMTAKKVVDSITSDIKRHMLHSKVEAVLVKCGNVTWKPSISSSTKTSISAEKLAELGVSADIIKKATVVGKESWSLRVTKIGGGDEDEAEDGADVEAEGVA